MSFSQFIKYFFGKGKPIERFNLDRCYRFSEYRESFDYAQQHQSISGVKEQIKSLKQESDNYKKEVAAITEPERGTEQKKYEQWEKFFKKKYMCKWISMGIVAIVILLYNTIGASWLFGVFYLLMILSILVALILKGIEVVHSMMYKHYIKKISNQIYAVNQNFGAKAAAYYEKVDALYLSSLDPGQREVVLNNRERLRLEKERNELERQRLQEQRRASETQEKLLQIEQKREERYEKNRW